MIFVSGSVWNPKNNGKEKKNTKLNDFHMFGLTVETIKKSKYYQNSSKFSIFIDLLVLI